MEQACEGNDIHNTTFYGDDFIWFLRAGLHQSFGVCQPFVIDIDGDVGATTEGADDMTETVLVCADNLHQVCSSETWIQEQFIFLDNTVQPSVYLFVCQLCHRYWVQINKKSENTLFSICQCVFHFVN